MRPLLSGSARKHLRLRLSSALMDERLKHPPLARTGSVLGGRGGRARVTVVKPTGPYSSCPLSIRKQTSAEQLSKSEKGH